MKLLALLWTFAGTRAATGWALAILIATVGGFWYVWDKRGDELQDLRLELSKCEGSTEQHELIQNLTAQLNRINQERARDEIEKLDALPNDCYELDGPSPLNSVRSRPSH